MIPHSTVTRKENGRFVFLFVFFFLENGQFTETGINREYSPGQSNPLRHRSNPLDDLHEVEINQRFRFSKDTVLSILEMIRDNITPLSDRDANIPPMLKLLAGLRFFATGSFQSVTSDLLNISQTSVSRILCNVSKAIAAHHHTFITFPAGNELPTKVQVFTNSWVSRGNRLYSCKDLLSGWTKFRTIQES